MREFGAHKTQRASQTAKVEFKSSQNVNGTAAVLFSICDKKSTNQSRDRRCHIFVTDATWVIFQKSPKFRY